MFNRNTDREWERLGRSEPYFGVVTNEKFRCGNLDERNREEFFRSGETHINRVLSMAEQIRPGFSIRRALDFGCGVGRLVIPLAGLSEQVTGLDVSESMLREARANCDARGLKNVALMKSDDRLASLNGKFDFIHSFVVFQHIPVTRGYRIFGGLLTHLEAGGVCACHFTYAKDTKAKYVMHYLTKYLPFSRNFINLVKGRGFMAPQMQMNNYSMNVILEMIRGAGASCCHLDFTDHEGHLGAVVYCTRFEGV